MNTAEMKERITATSPRFQDRVIGIFYLVTIVTGVAVFFANGRMGLLFDLIAAVCYVAMAAAFYELTRINRSSKQQANVPVLGNRIRRNANRA